MDEERVVCCERATLFFDGTKVLNFQALCRTWHGSAASRNHVQQSDRLAAARRRLQTDHHD